MNAKRLLFIGAHPDDELYALGTMKLLSDRGYELSEILFSCGENGSVIRDGVSVKLSKEETKEIRMREHSLAVQRLCMTRWRCLDSDDGRIEKTDDLIWSIVEEIRSVRPTIIITHSARDSHPDHITVSTTVLDAARRAAVSVRSEALGPKYRVPILLFVEGYVPESGAMYVDVSAYKQFKREYMSQYQSQLSESLVRSIECSDVKNGVMFGVEAAEAFVYEPSWPPLVSVLW